MLRFHAASPCMLLQWAPIPPSETPRLEGSIDGWRHLSVRLPPEITQDVGGKREALEEPEDLGITPVKDDTITFTLNHFAARNASSFMYFCLYFHFGKFQSHFSLSPYMLLRNPHHLSGSPDSVLQIVHLILCKLCGFRRPNKCSGIIHVSSPTACC
jgi:hypothetical protein